MHRNSKTNNNIVESHDPIVNGNGGYMEEIKNKIETFKKHMKNNKQTKELDMDIDISREALSKFRKNSTEKIESPNQQHKSPVIESLGSLRQEKLDDSFRNNKNEEHKALSPTNTINKVSANAGTPKMSKLNLNRINSNIKINNLLIPRTTSQEADTSRNNSIGPGQNPFTHIITSIKANNTNNCTRVQSSKILFQNAKKEGKPVRLSIDSMSSLYFDNHLSPTQANNKIKSTANAERKVVQQDNTDNMSYCSNSYFSNKSQSSNKLKSRIDDFIKELEWDTQKKAKKKSKHILIDEKKSEEKYAYPYDNKINTFNKKIKRNSVNDYNEKPVFTFSRPAETKYSPYKITGK